MPAGTAILLLLIGSLIGSLALAAYIDRETETTVNMSRVAGEQKARKDSQTEPSEDGSTHR
ncbi:hypothetical protein [Natronocalculus amylovorans]|uniref:Uncharacterized protein n=1 Tax=Natronocalculus amylovorans TaxID=2917812 RepID=A0AAE3FZ49_9EURY|nr:hypothetical protein [Natronocalculus amylovorans]MCL9817966.1 hypothetical protein [Natronocalculus amylovorans]